MVSDYLGKVESDDGGEFELEVGGKIGSMDGRSVGKHVKGGVDVRIYDSVG